MTSLSNLPKKRGRPLGSKNKRKVAKKVAVKEVLLKQNEIEGINDFVEELINEIKSQRAIISYLENKLEPK